MPDRNSEHEMLRSPIKQAFPLGQLHGLRESAPELSDLVRFRDPATGNTWTGFGRPPNWIRGKDRERFRVRPDTDSSK